MSSGNAIPYTPRPRHGVHGSEGEDLKDGEPVDVGHGHELDVRGLGLACAEALQVGDEEGDAVDELLLRERLDGHEDEISPEHRARQALDQREMKSVTATSRL